MRIGKDHSFPGKSIKVGCGDFAFRIEARNVTITHVVYQEDDDVRILFIRHLWDLS